MKKYYCTSFRISKNLIDNYSGWYIEYTNRIDGYALYASKYYTKQIFETEAAAINSILELKNGGHYMKVNY